jgi:hypothetical protein
MQPSLKDLPQVQEAWNYSLFDAIFNRRSRRFGLGMEITEGPTRFKSPNPPVPLDEEEEALLVAAGTGLSGIIVGDIPMSTKGEKDVRYWESGASTLMSFQGRTWGSPCNAHGTELFYTNDSGVYLVRLRDAEDTSGQSIASRDDADRALELFRRHRVQLSTERIDIPAEQPALFSFNLWNANKPGSTLFMPVTDISEEFLNLILLLTEYEVFLVDDVHGNRPCGNERWLKEKIIREESLMPITQLEKLAMTATCFEAAFIGQNLMLAIQAMGLGGWLFGGFTPLVVLGGTPVAKGLGFRFVQGKDGLGIPSPVGLDGLFEGLCPPYHTMNEAVDIIVEKKWGKRGCFSTEHPHTLYKCERDVLGAVPPSDERVIQCTKDIANYIVETFGKFPATVDAMQLLVMIQAHHLELEFYDTFFQPGAYTETQRNHMKKWHAKAKLARAA